jgi:hypothetical protein
MALGDVLAHALSGSAFTIAHFNVPGTANMEIS